MRAICGLLGILLSCVILAAEPITNRLSDSSSPYLAMHGSDPVHWQTWDKSTFERARRENKLLFVSSGYFSCHWCHVMQRESYRDADIAAYINKHFIPIKIDRELLPDVDAGLIDFAEHTRGQAGWPLNVFLTPNGHPLIAVLYLPPQTFQNFLTNLTERWTSDSMGLAGMAQRAAEHVTTTPPELSAAVDTKDLSAMFVEQALAMADELAGGFGAQNKFPMVPQLWALLDAYERADDARLEDFLKLTLEQMASQGLRDHLSGGFFRYTIDPAWQTPHFEKMLYDNALLARLYIRAATLFDSAEFAEIARVTLDFVLTYMQAPAGGYYAAFSAVDAAGVEGGYYLWAADELERLAGDDWPLLRHYFGLKEAEHLEAGYHLIPRMPIKAAAADLDLSEEQARLALGKMQEKLLARRAQRELPIDTKVLTGWNGLLLTALVEAAQYFEPDAPAPRYRLAARRLRAFLIEQHVRKDRVLRALTENAVTPAGLEDYAYLLEGLQAWQLAYGQGAEPVPPALIEQAWERFYRDGRWYQGEDFLLRWRDGEAAVADGPMPAAPAVLMAVSAERKREIGPALKAALPKITAQPFWHASYVNLH